MMPEGVDSDSLVYLDGEWLKLGEAKVSVLDRGFIFGDGIYEVVPAYGGRPFRMEAHLARLARSLAAVRIETGRSPADWTALVQEMLARHGGGNTVVYLQVTRGVAKRDHAFPAGIRPTVFCMASPFTRPDAALRSRGMSTAAMADERWLHCDIKSVSLLGNVLARQQAVDLGVDDVILFRNGWLTEASAANIWVVRNGVLLAPPADNQVLEGIRYRFLQELAESEGLPFEARPISRAEVDGADELMLTSATKEVLPITRFEGRPVGDGKPGPVYARLRAAYDRVIDAHAA